MRIWRKWRNPTVKPPFGARIDWSDPITQGLVGCWLLRIECAGEYGLVGIENMGEINGVHGFGDAAIFNNSNIIIDDYDEIGEDVRNEITVCAKLASNVTLTTDGDTYRFLEKGDCYYLLQGNGGSIGSGGLLFAVKEAGIVKYASTNIPLDAGVEYLITGVFDGDYLYTYINTTKFTGQGAGVIDNDRLPLYIGSDDSGKYWNGKGWFVYIWKRALTDSEIERLYYEPYSFFLAPFPIVMVDLGAGQSYAYEGNIPLGLIPSSVKEVRYYREGQAPIVITPQAEAQATYRREGQQSIALTPGAEARATYRKEGNVLLRFAVAAEKAARYFALGQVPVAVQVAGEKQVLYRRTGSTPLSLIPDAQVRASYTHEGNVPLALSVQADIACRFSVDGRVGLVILPQGTWIYQPATGGTVYTYVGNIPLAILPEAEAKALFSETGEIFLNITPAAEVQAVYRPISELLLQLRPEGEATLAFSIEGEIQLRLTPQGVAVLIKPSESEELFVIGIIEEDDIRAVFDGALHATIWPRQ